MKSVIFACLLAVAMAQPQSYYQSSNQQQQHHQQPQHHQQVHRFDNDRVIQILRDDRQQPEGGHYSFDFESEDGIKRSESGSPLDIPENPTGKQGEVSFTLPNGEQFELKYVADENGFQPESSHLPVAPEFPHPIPQFVLDQIAKAEREDAEGFRSESNNYNRYD